MTVLRIALAQLNPTVGDLEGNLAKLIHAYDRAEADGCDIIAFPELSITGYPPEDLVLKPRFVADNRSALDRFAAYTRGCAAVVGFVDADRDIYNAAAVCVSGKVAGTYRKRLLPNYAVFDEARTFTPGTENDPLELYEIAGVKVGISICEDIWSPFGPLATQAAGGAELSVNINGSPYHWNKDAYRERMVATHAQDAHTAIVYVNQVGAQDELVFDGGSFVVDAEGRLLARSPQFVEDLMVVDLPIPPIYRNRLLDPRGKRTDGELPIVHVSDISRRPAAALVESPIAEPLDSEAELYQALVLGTRDYCRKNGFTDVVIGLSGGIDSTIVAVIAADALGPDHVHGVSMPSRYSSDHSKSDAQLLAENLGIECRTVSIEPAFDAYIDMLGASFEGRTPGLTYENIQSRCRGQVLMALSNEFGWMVLTTGNKSEMAVGYFTIYGDSVGGYAVIKDVLKTRVYDICRWVNASAGSDIIPPDVITKPPSAELRPDQRDDQSLPPYEVLDPILQLYVEQDWTATQIVEAGHDEAIVRRVTRLVDVAEYKRYQCPPGVKVSTKAFGRDRRLPITNAYRGWPAHRIMKIGVQLPEVEYEIAFADLVSMAQLAEDVGFDAIWLGDHLLYQLEAGPRGPWEVWTTLAALSASTQRIELGPLVASTSFHAPAMLAKMAATVDAISDGRLTLGLGAGWNQREYTAFGFPYDHRVSRFEEAFTIVRTLLREGAIDFHGSYYEVTDAVLHPRSPRPGGPPLMIGSIAPRMQAITLPHVDAWNVWWSEYGNTAAGFADVKATVDERLAAIGRSGQVEATCAVYVKLPTGTGRQMGDYPKTSPPIEGPPDEIADQLRGFVQVGAAGIQLVVDPIVPASLESLGEVLALLR